MIPLLHHYATLGDAFAQHIAPDPVQEAGLLLWNAPLAGELGLPDALADDPAMLAEVFSGNRLLPGSQPLALAYAGHQFGHFVPQLGDGRAHLLGELQLADGRLRDLQLKGSGRTGFSRGGDGRCALGPAVREFVLSEAMAALGIPTTRCLAVVTSGEPVLRGGRARPGAIVTRVAASHVRIGTFQYFAARGDEASLQTLCDFALARHFPEALEGSGNRALQLLDAVIARQVELVVQWMRVGFIHGVMNTDNCTISGETIDYGPCAMMNAYDPETVYSSIDTVGRYAFGRQPEMVQWNLARLAEALLPLVDADRRRAIDAVQERIFAVPERYRQAYMQMMGQKFGFASVAAADVPLLESMLDQLTRQSLDYTNTFDRLRRSLLREDLLLADTLGVDYGLWRQRVAAQPDGVEQAAALMQRVNPLVIARNHHVEAALAACEDGDVKAVELLLAVLRTPHELLPQTARYQDAPDDESGYHTFCGT